MRSSDGSSYVCSSDLQRRDFGYSIVEPAPPGSPLEDDIVVGGSGLHGRVGLEQLDIGYWVRADRGGRGVATAVSRALTVAAFQVPGVQRVRIQCEDTNHRSARVPEKLGYRFEGTSVPDDGPCAARPTQTWIMERSHWPVYSVLSPDSRSEERRAGKVCVSTCRSRWSPSPV